MEPIIHEITALGAELGVCDIDIVTLSEQLIADFGVDGGDITEAELIDVLSGRGTDKWSEFQFACNEGLACYRGYRSFTKEELLRSIVMMFVLADSIRHGKGHIFHYDRIFKILRVNRDKCSEGTRDRIVGLVTRRSQRW